MSVGTRRFALAQRTAVTTPSRLRRLGAWIIIVPAFSLFSFSVIAGAAGFRAKPDVAAAEAKVVPKGHDEGKSAGERDNGTSTSNDNHQDPGSLVVVDSHGEGGLPGLFGKGGKQVCWISTSQLTRVSAVYRTSTSTIRVGQTTYTIVTIYGASERDLKQLLGTYSVKCRLVHAAKLFFLPFDPNLS